MSQYIYHQNDEFLIAGDAKQAYAHLKEFLGNPDKPKSTGQAVSPKEHFMQTLLKEYDQYYNPVTKIYEIEEDWQPTREELKASIERSWEFEKG